VNDDLNSLAADLARAGLRAGVQSRVVVEKGAFNIKTDARRFASGMAHLPRYPHTITYDVSLGPDGFEAEVGPENRGQGSLGHLIEFGTATSGPNAHMGPALDREGPRFVKAVEDLGEIL
jgi:hypothetical protein